MIHPALRTLGVATLLLAGLAACAPVYSVPHGGHVRADTAHRTQQHVYRTRDGRVFPTRAARDAYLARLDARDRELYRQQARQNRRSDRHQRRAQREARLIREERRLQRIEQDRIRAERRLAKAERAARQARREARRAERQADAAQANALRRAQQNTRTARNRAQDATRRANRQAANARRQDRIARRQNRVDTLAPRPRLPKATLQKIGQYSAYRRPGENVPAFVTRIAEAERRASEVGSSVAYWLTPPSQRPRRGASER